MRISRRKLAFYGAAGILAAPAAASSGSPIAAGAIRWDAWYANTGPAREAQNALGYAAWQSRAPWFAKIDGPNHISAVGTQADMDQECRYAAAAGLKYWAFVNYAQNSPMSAAWQLYQSSPQRDLVNWCGIIGPGALGNDPFSNTNLWQAKDDGWVNYFKQPNYQTVETNRPLLYILWSQSEISDYYAGQQENFAASVAYLRARCQTEGVGNPYIVIMAGAAKTSAGIMRALGADAISNYIPDSGAAPVGATPWRVLDQRTQAFWASMASQGVDCIPIATTGWDTRARRMHPESWTHETPDPDPQNYFVLPTGAELTAHLRAAAAFIQDHPAACPSKALLIYSWDECDEGGNPLIPTYTPAGTNHAALDAAATALK